MSYTPENLKLWKHPSCYVGATWDGWYVFLGCNRESDCLTRANFDEALERLQPFKVAEIVGGDVEDADLASVQTVRENHWAVGWVEWIAIHQSNESALRAADEMAGQLENYPVLSEERWSEYEQEEANQVWANCYDAKERVAYIRQHRGQFEFHGPSDLLSVVRGKYFNGYASELLS